MQPEENSRYAILASRHHESALATFRSDVAKVDTSNSRAVAIFSISMALFSYGVPNVRGFPVNASPISMFLNVLSLLRTAWSTLGPEIDEVERGPLKEMLKPNNISHRRPLGESSQKLLRDLQSYVEACEESSEDKAICVEAMLSLEGYFWCLPDYSPFSDLLGWPLTVSDRFFELLCEKKPFPLFCLAYFMVTFCQTESFWLTPWAKPVLAEIWWTLDEPLRRFVDWPASYVHLSPPVVHQDQCRCFDCYITEKLSDFAWRDNAAPLLAKRANR